MLFFNASNSPSSGFTQVCVGHSLVKHGELLSMIRDFMSLEVSHISAVGTYDPVNHGFCDLRSSISPCEFPPWVSQSPTISTIFLHTAHDSSPEREPLWCRGSELLCLWQKMRWGMWHESQSLLAIYGNRPHGICIHVCTHTHTHTHICIYIKNI